MNAYWFKLVWLVLDKHINCLCVSSSTLLQVISEECDLKHPVVFDSGIIVAKCGYEHMSFFRSLLQRKKPKIMFGSIHQRQKVKW